MPRPKKIDQESQPSYLDRIEQEVNSNQSRISLVLGALILIVAAVLLFNYFSKAKPEIGPSQQTPLQTLEDVSLENLPGKYTVKEGDTLFTIAEKYYKDGFKYTEIEKINNLTDPNAVEAGQVLEIPKLATTAEASSTPTPAVDPSAMPIVSPSPTPIASTPMVNYGPAITGNTYTVVEGDWLSTIAARAYNGDIMAYLKLAQANNIPNPDYIIPGMVLTIPR